MGSLLETTMLVCFGFSWPLGVLKSYKAGTTKGMSLPFILLIIFGYVAGIAAKTTTGQFNYVLAVYGLNLAIVAVNLLVYFRNAALDKRRAEPRRRVAPAPSREKPTVPAFELNSTGGPFVSSLGPFRADD